MGPVADVHLCVGPLPLSLPPFLARAGPDRVRINAIPITLHVRWCLISQPLLCPAGICTPTPSCSDTAADFRCFLREGSANVDFVFGLPKVLGRAGDPHLPPLPRQVKGQLDVGHPAVGGEPSLRPRGCTSPTPLQERSTTTQGRDRRSSPCPMCAKAGSRTLRRGADRRSWFAGVSGASPRPPGARGSCSPEGRPRCAAHVRRPA